MRLVEAGAVRTVIDIAKGDKVYQPGVFRKTNWRMARPLSCCSIAFLVGFERVDAVA